MSSAKTPLEEEILAAVRRIAGSHTDNEATSMPAWWITTPRFGSGDPGRILSSVLGPFWSREAADDWLKTKGYRFTKKSRVFCGSLHDNPELRRLYELSRQMKEAETPLADPALCDHRYASPVPGQSCFRCGAPRSPGWIP